MPRRKLTRNIPKELIVSEEEKENPDNIEKVEIVEETLEATVNEILSPRRRSTRRLMPTVAPSSIPIEKDIEEKVVEITESSTPSGKSTRSTRSSKNAPPVEKVDETEILLDGIPNDTSSTPVKKTTRKTRSVIPSEVNTHISDITEVSNDNSMTTINVVENDEKSSTGIEVANGDKLAPSDLISREKDGNIIADLKDCMTIEGNNQNVDTDAKINIDGSGDIAVEENKIQINVHLEESKMEMLGDSSIETVPEYECKDKMDVNEPVKSEVHEKINIDEKICTDEVKPVKKEDTEIEDIKSSETIHDSNPESNKEMTDIQNPNQSEMDIFDTAINNDIPAIEAEDKNEHIEFEEMETEELDYEEDPDNVMVFNADELLVVEEDPDFMSLYAEGVEAAKEEAVHHLKSAQKGKENSSTEFKSTTRRGSSNNSRDKASDKTGDKKKLSDSRDRGKLSDRKPGEKSSGNDREKFGSRKVDDRRKSQNSRSQDRSNRDNDKSSASLLQRGRRSSSRGRRSRSRSRGRWSPSRSQGRRSRSRSKGRSSRRSVDDKNKRSRSQDKPVSKKQDDKSYSKTESSSKSKVNDKTKCKENIGGSDKFSRIVILADPMYKSRLDIFVKDSVKVVYKECLNEKTIIDIIHQHSKSEKFTRNTLWVLFKGLKSLVKVRPHSQCKNCKDCSDPMLEITDNNKSTRTAEEQISTLCSDVQKKLQSNNYIVVLPPFPEIIHKNISSITHKELHDVPADCKIVIENSQTSFNALYMNYNNFCKYITATSLKRMASHFDNTGFLKYMKDYRNIYLSTHKSNYEIRQLLWYDIMEDFFYKVFQTKCPNEALARAKISPKDSKSIEDVLKAKKEPKKRKSVEEVSSDSLEFNQVVVIGNMRYTQELQELTKDLPVIHRDVTIAFDKTGLSFLNKEQKKYPKKTLWIIITGVSQLSTMINPLSSCEHHKCIKPMVGFVPKHTALGHEEFRNKPLKTLIDFLTNKAFNFAIDSSEHLLDDSALFLAPIMPLFALFDGAKSSRAQHAAVHDRNRKEPNIPILSGNLRDWRDCASSLNIEWLNKIKENIPENSVPHEILEDYIDKDVLVLDKGDMKDSRLSWSIMMANLIKHYLGRGGYTGSSPQQEIKGDQFSQASPSQKMGTDSDGEIPATKKSSLHPLVALADSLIVPTPHEQQQNQDSQPMQRQDLGPFEANSAYDSWNTGYDQGWLNPAQMQHNPVMAMSALPYGNSTIQSPPQPVQNNAQRPQTTSYTIKAEPKLKPTMKGSLVVTNCDIDMDKTQITNVLKAFGDFEDIKWPKPSKQSAKGFMIIHFKNRKHAERAVRILGCIKLFGDDAQIKLLGGENTKDKAGELKSGEAGQLRSGDLEVLLTVNDILEKPKTGKTISQTSKIDLSKPISPNLQTTTKQGFQMAPQPGLPMAPLPGSQAAPQPPAPVKPKKIQRTITVSNYTKIVPVNCINEMFNQLGAVGVGVIISGFLHFTFEGEIAVLKLLSGLRFPDTKMIVNIKEEKIDRNLQSSEIQAAKETIKEPLAKVMREIAKIMKSAIDEEVNVYTFKTRLCRYADGCKLKALCHGYHNKTDRRRCPMLFKYSPEMCKSMETPDSCPLKMGCSSAHSPLEILFHFSNYKSKICPGWKLKGACDKNGRVCASAHPETADSFYNERWRHLYVEGLDRTVHYLASAIKNLCMIPKLKCVRVLLITPSPEMVKLYIDCVKDLAKCCNQTVAEFDGKSIDDDTTVLIAETKTIGALMAAVNRGRNSLDKIKAFILDDGPTVLNSLTPKKRDIFRCLGLRDVNIVITAEDILDAEVKLAVRCTAARSSFKNVFLNSSSSKNTKTSSIPASLSFYMDDLNDIKKKVNPSKDGQASFKKDNMRSDSQRNKQPPKVETESKKTLGTSKAENKLKSKIVEEYIKSKKELERDYERELELYTDTPEVHPDYEQKYGEFSEQYQMEFPERNDNEHCNSLWEQFWKELISVTLKEEYDEKNQKLEKEHVIRLKAIDNQKQDRESKESHKRKSPDDQRSSRGSKYRREDRGSNSSRNERKRSSSVERQRDLQRRRSPVRGSERDHKRSKLSPPKDSSSYLQRGTRSEKYDPSRPREPDFVEDSITLLDDISSSLGMLEPSLKILIRKLRDCGSNNERLGEVVGNEDNQLILKKTFERTRALSTISNSNVHSLTMKIASEHAQSLLKRFTPKSKQQNYFGLNLERIAQATYNQGTPHIIGFIKQELSNVIAHVSDKEINDIYVAITSLQVKMAYAALEPKNTSSIPQINQDIWLKGEYDRQRVSDNRLEQYDKYRALDIRLEEQHDRYRTPDIRIEDQYDKYRAPDVSAPSQIDFQSPSREYGNPIASGATLPMTQIDYSHAGQSRDYGHSVQSRDYGHSVQIRDYGHAAQSKDKDHAVQSRDYGHAPQNRDYGHEDQSSDYSHVGHNRDYGLSIQSRDYGHSTQNTTFDIPRQGNAHGQSIDYGHGRRDDKVDYDMLKRPQPGNMGSTIDYSHGNTRFGGSGRMDGFSQQSMQQGSNNGGGEGMLEFLSKL